MTKHRLLLIIPAALLLYNTITSLLLTELLNAALFAIGLFVVCRELLRDS